MKALNNVKLWLKVLNNVAHWPEAMTCLILFNELLVQVSNVTTYVIYIVLYFYFMNIHMLIIVVTHIAYLVTGGDATVKLLFRPKQWLLTVRAALLTRL